MNIKTLGLASIILASITTSAYSAEKANWGGFYIGASAGENFGNNNADYAHGREACTPNNFGSDGGLCSGNQNYSHNIENFLHSAIAGIHAGYNWDMNNYIVGIESSITTKSQDDDHYEIISGFGDNLRIRNQQNYTGSIKMNIGMPVNNFLIYTGAGVSGGELETTVVQTAESYPSRTFSDHDFKIGYTVGGGVKYKLTSNWVLGGEYNYINLGSSRLDGERIIPPSTIVYPDSTLETHNTDHVAQVNLSYQF